MIQRIQTLWMVLTAVLVGAAVSVAPQGEIWFLVIGGIAGLLPLATIFLFGNRSRQTSLLIVEFLLLAGTLGFGVYYSWVTRTIWTYAPVLTFAALGTNWGALRGVLRDEMLIRSADRIR